MMHLEFINQEYKGCRIDIRPGSDSEIPGLRDMIFHNLIIENPTCYFTAKYKSGEYDGRSEEELSEEAGKSVLLADLWDNKPGMNAIMLLSRALQTIVDLKSDMEGKAPSDPVEEDWDDVEFDEFDDSCNSEFPEWFKPDDKKDDNDS